MEVTSASPRTCYTWRGTGVTILLLYRDDYTEPLNYRKVLCHVDMFLGGDSEISDCTAAVARHRPTMRSVPSCCKQNNCSKELVMGQSPDRK